MNKTERMKLTPTLSYICCLFFLSSNLGFPPVLQTRLYVGATSTTCTAIVFIFIFVLLNCPKISLVDCNRIDINLFSILSQCQWAANDADVLYIFLCENQLHSTVELWIVDQVETLTKAKELNPWVRCAMFILNLCLDIFSWLQNSLFKKLFGSAFGQPMHWRWCSTYYIPAHMYRHKYIPLWISLHCT